MSTFRSSRCVAKLCRRVWGDTRLAMPAVRAASRTTRLNWRVDVGLTGFCPGNSAGLRPRRPPPVAQPFQQLRREHDIAVALALALFDAQGHALAVDIGNLERHDLGHAQSRAVGDAERGLVLQAGRCFEQASHLFLVQDHQRLARLMHAGEMATEFWPVERDVEEEPQR